MQTRTCLPCVSPCRTCLNLTACLSCSRGFLDGAACVGSCPQLFFANLTARVCQSCHPRCTSCNNTSTNCLACADGFFLLGSSCLQACPLLTHYPNGSRCEACRSPCLQCVSLLECLSCQSGYLLDSRCYSQCPDGYFGNLTSRACSPCPDPNCLKCSSSSSC